MLANTLLQAITDTLEAAGIGVSGIETWPPEEDGRVSVSMTVRPRPEPEQTDVSTFIEACLEHDPSWCETVNAVCEEYKKYKGTEKVARVRLIGEIIKYFRERGKLVSLVTGDTDKKPATYLNNIRLIQKTAATLDAINAAKAPDDPPVVRDPCGECTLGDCDNCQVKDSTPIKIYTKKEAAMAMLSGRILLNAKNEKCFWNGGTFCIENDRKRYTRLSDFTGLYEEARYV